MDEPSPAPNPRSARPLRLAPADWQPLAPPLVDVALAAAGFGEALRRTDPLIARLIPARFAYGSAASAVFGDGSIPHADLHAALYDRQPAEADAVRRRAGLNAATELYDALLRSDRTPLPSPSVGVPFLSAIEACRNATHPAETNAAFRILSTEVIGIPEAPPLCFALPDPTLPDGEWTERALRTMTDTLIEACRITDAANAYADCAHRALEDAGCRRSNAAFPLAIGLAALPLVTRVGGVGILPIRRSAFTSAARRLAELGLAREVTSRSTAKAWVAVDDALTPSFSLPGIASDPPSLRSFEAKEPLGLRAHDAAAADAASKLDALLERNRG